MNLQSSFSLLLVVKLLGRAFFSLRRQAGLWLIVFSSQSALGMQAVSACLCLIRIS